MINNKTGNDENDMILQLALITIAEQQADIERIAAGKISLKKDRNLIKMLAQMGLAAKRKLSVNIDGLVKAKNGQDK